MKKVDIKDPSTRPINLALLLTGIEAPGGIQRFNRLLFKAANAYVQPTGGRVSALTFHDHHPWVDPDFPGCSIPGVGGNQVEFVQRALRMLSRRFDAVVTDHVDFAPIVWAAQLRQPSRPWMVVTHGIDVWGSLPLSERFPLRRASLVAAVSDFTRDQVVTRFGVDPQRTALFPNALDPKFESALSTPTEPARAGILTISRLDAKEGRDKGIDTTIQALPTVLREVPETTLTIVGDGDDRPRLAALADSLGVAHAVSFAGRVSDDELKRLLRTSAIFALPSRAEGFGIVYLEAMAHGLPVVGGNFGGVPEVVLHGETGYLVPHGAVSDLAAHLVRLLQDESLRDRLGEAGKERVRTHFTYDVFQANCFRLIDRLMQGYSLASETERVLASAD